MNCGWGRFQCRPGEGRDPYAAAPVVFRTLFDGLASTIDDRGYGSRLKAGTTWMDSRPHHASMHGRLRPLRCSGFGTDLSPDMIQCLVSAGSMTSSISSTEAIETALPLA
ncbi:hypothetical protein ABIE49_006645 [Bradyrhizobium sp. OAE829]